MESLTPHCGGDSPADESSKWSEAQLADPHAVADKARRVRAMFAAIAHRYDLNNRLHSLGRDQAWRRAAARAAGVRPGDMVLDVACGTGDLSLAMAKGGAQWVVGVDFTAAMLAVAARKTRRSAARSVAYIGGDAMRLPMAADSADVVSIAFGIRNVADPRRAIQEFARVLRVGGRLVILEFSLPRWGPARAVYQFYFRRVLPRTAAWIAKDRAGAYRYLPQSVNTFLERETLMGLMREGGFAPVRAQALTLGVAVLYVGVKQT